MRKYILIFLALAFVIGLLLASKSLSAASKQSPKPTQKTTSPSTEFSRSKQEYIKIISTDEKWYLHPKIKPKIEAYFKGSEKGKSKEWVTDKRAFIQMVGDMLDQGEVKLGTTGENFDEGRQAVDTIVIHHTETDEKASYGYLQAIHLFNLYVVPVYGNPENSNYGKPIYSGHFDENGKQVFYAYHYIVKPDGTVKHALSDDEIGWHAKQANDHSVAIAFIGNYNKKPPTTAAIQKAKDIIESYPDTMKVVGHRDVVTEAECPGDTFYGENGWRKKLIN